jgi:L-lactate dehydrogenase complex protein LldG
MTSSRDQILNKLRAARKPFPDAPPRPRTYLPVALLDDTSPDARLDHFTNMLNGLGGDVFPVNSDKAAKEKVLELLATHKATSILAWDFKYIPVRGLKKAIEDAGITIIQPDMHDEFRAEVVETIRDAQVGLTGVDAAAAATGTLIVSTGPGKGRIPTVLAPVHIAVITIDQLLPRIEDWVARERANGLPTIHERANVCFITGVSQTGDVEMIMVRGVHGPGKVQVVVKK